LDTRTAERGEVAAAAVIPAWMVFFGFASVPAFESLPLTVST
jgi:hypothetical protein